MANKTGTLRLWDLNLGLRVRDWNCGFGFGGHALGIYHGEVFKG